MQKLHDEALSRAALLLPSMTTTVSPTPDITFVIISSDRPRPYISALLTEILPYHLPVHVINTHIPAANHSALEPLRSSPSLPNLIIQDLYIQSDTQKSDSNTKEQKIDEWLGRQFLAYIAALEACSESGTAYCVIFEDDALPSHRFLTQLRSVISALPKFENNFLLKLYRGTDLDGFQADLRGLLTVLLLPTMLCAQLLFSLVMFMFLHRNIRADGRVLYGHRKGSRNGIKISLIFSTIFINCLVGVVLYSRQAFIELFYGDVTNQDVTAISLDMEVANIAIVYPLESVMPLRDQFWMRLYQRYPKLEPIDIELLGWIRAMNWTALMTNRAIVQHIGAFSTNPERIDKPNFLRFDHTFRY